MSNVIPLDRRGEANAATHVAARFLVDPERDSHAVQFYETDAFLTQTVTRFLTAGLESGDRIVVIATRAHREAFLAKLGPRAARRAVADGQLLLLDANETLTEIMVGDLPDVKRFRAVLERAIAKVREGHADERVRAYGEMVDLLWRDGNPPAAIRLVELWNEAGKTHAFSLLCAYAMGNFYKEGDTASFLEVCRAHSHVVPTESFTRQDDPHARLREISLLQQRARALENEIHHRRELESALRDALQERRRAEEELRDAVEREKRARQQAEASDAFKEMFLGILGHDLRNPLNAVLTTTRLMRVRGELPADSARRLERVVASGVRMERMIEQLLDVARARLADGIPVTKTAESDLVLLAAKIVDEMQASHPTRRIELRAAGPCLARVDADRIEQVVSNLLANALDHGDAREAVTVTVTSEGALASLSVHNVGKPIEPATLATIFDPFRRGNRVSERSSDGLGLGLYIAERIVGAHGGRIDVDSSLEAGTRFEAILPR